MRTRSMPVFLRSSSKANKRLLSVIRPSRLARRPVVLSGNDSRETRFHLTPGQASRRIASAIETEPVLASSITAHGFSFEQIGINYVPLPPPHRPRSTYPTLPHPYYVPT